MVAATPDPTPQVLWLLDPILPYIFALFAVVMTVYFVLHIANCDQRD